MVVWVAFKNHWIYIVYKLDHSTILKLCWTRKHINKKRKDKKYSLLADYKPAILFHFGLNIFIVH